MEEASYAEIPSLEVCAGRDREKLTAIKEPLALEAHAQTHSRPVLQMLATCSYLS